MRGLLGTAWQALCRNRKRQYTSCVQAASYANSLDNPDSFTHYFPETTTKTSDPSVSDENINRFRQRTYHSWLQRKRRQRISEKQTNDSTACLNLAQPSWRTAFLVHSLSLTAVLPQKWSGYSAACYFPLTDERSPRFASLEPE